MEGLNKNTVCVFMCVCSEESEEQKEQYVKELQSTGKRSVAPHRSLVHMRINLVPVFDVNRT